MNLYLKFIDKYEEKISAIEIILMVFITAFLGSMFIFSLSLADKTSSLALFVMFCFSLASVHYFWVFLADNIQFGKDVNEASAQAEKKWGVAKKKFEEEKDAEFRIRFRKIKMDVIKFGISILPVGLLGYAVDWMPIFHNMKEWLNTLGTIFIGIFN
mgnify:FL=1